MRSVAYGAAILAAAGIMYLITTTNSEPANEIANSEPATSVAPNDDASESDAAGAIDVTTASLTMKVPEMHCPFACYPSVKKNLEKRDDVLSVELAPQKQEGVIDNPEVIVTYKTGFDADNAIAMLEEVGFSGSTVVNE